MMKGKNLKIQDHGSDSRLHGIQKSPSERSPINLPEEKERDKGV